jgi:hypothetical protein
MYDLIGDIHGHAGALERLLEAMGYRRREGAWRLSGRQVVFLGDFVDRGPRIAETLAIARGMVESGAALAVMGNHELNALAYHTPDPDRPEEHLRPHTEKNAHQHAETVRQLSAGELRSHLEWFRTLPLWLDLGGLRAVHACWDDALMGSITAARAAGPLDEDFLVAACRTDGRLFGPVEAILKGKEARLPQGVRIRDKEGIERRACRVQWYADPTGHTYRSYAMPSERLDCDAPLAPEVVAAARPYAAGAAPVFVGHYWMRGESPSPLASNVACLDWSVARGGFLCGYRWDGEREIDPRNFVTVPASPEER